jgi:Na+-translocating ferredoxin:NAD+ oxidoreductase RnfE subunit
VCTVVAPEMAVGVDDAVVDAVLDGVDAGVGVVAEVTTGVLAEVLVGGFVAAVTGAALTVDVSPAAPHSSVAPLLVASPL